MTSALELAIKAIKKAGFGYIKLELEANLSRRGSFGNNQYCQDFMFDYLAKKAGKSEEDIENRKASNRTSGSHGVRNVTGLSLLPKLIYGEFYTDGSVDSEFTFTVKIEDAEYVLDVMEAFKALAKRNKGGLDVRGAGMHFSVMPSSKYPCPKSLNPEKLENFTREVTKLLPALYISACSGNFTRGLKFRQPQISHSDGQTHLGRGKYSAIFTHNGSCLEYRLFETCYQRPEAIFEYLGVIAKTLEFYADPTKRVVSLGKQFNIYGDKNLKGFTDLPDQVSILKAQFKYIKPDGMTLRDFIQNRGINLTVKGARTIQGRKIEKLRDAYKEHYKAQMALRDKKFDQYEEDVLTYEKMNHPGQTEDWYWERVTGIRLTLPPTEEIYINNNLRKDTPIGVINV